MSKVEDFLNNGGFEVTKSGTNSLNNIEMEGTPRDPEEDNVGEICINKDHQRMMVDPMFMIV